MAILIAGLIIFFGVHSISIVNRPWRERMFAHMGEKKWKALYSITAFIGFVMLVYGYGLARQHPIVVYVPPYWLRYLTGVLMLPVFPLLFASHLPGKIKSTVKHPMLAAVKLWATAHLLANGMLADILLFGGFLAWAVIDRISVKHNPRGPVDRMAPSTRNDVIAIVGGLITYVVFMRWLHGWLIGVVPFPM
jgi:uncharacterized membrane protein